MIRLLACALLLPLLALPALGNDWTRYVNPRFGSAVDVPANYLADGTPSVPGEGKVFRADHGRAKITTWGGPTQNADFMAEIARRIGADEGDGWSITYRSETPDWASWTGTRGGHVFYAKAILTCGGSQTANVRLDYPAMDVPAFDPIVNRLGMSLGQDGACF